MSNYNLNVVLLAFKYAWIILVFFSAHASADNLHNMTSIDINAVKNAADVVLISKLEQLPPPYEVLCMNYYRIIPEDILSGSLPENSLIVVETNIDTWKGKPPMIESAFRYLLFLKKNEISEDKLPLNYIGYELVGNWKGILSIDDNAAEQRAIQSIERQYSISFKKHKFAFIDALRFSLQSVNSDNEKAVDEMSGDATFFYSKMGMDYGTSNKYEVAH